MHGAHRIDVKLWAEVQALSEREHDSGAKYGPGCGVSRKYPAAGTIERVAPHCDANIEERAYAALPLEAKPKAK